MYLNISMNNGTDNQKILGNCPSCQRLMQIPVVTDVASVAKCPHCQNEIRVRDLLASAVPEAEIIDKNKDSNRVSGYIADRQRVYDDNKQKPREKFEVPNQLYNGASRRNRKRRVGSKGSSSRSSSSRDSSSRRRPSNNGSSSSSQARPNSNADVVSKKQSSNVSSNNSPRPKSEASPNASKAASKSTPANSSRPRSSSSVAPNAAQERRAPTSVPRPRKSSSPRRRSSEMDDEVEFGFAEVVKFLVGGLIAAPLAYLALLWVLGVDPFGLAGTFERISPAIVPSSLLSESNEPRSGFAPPSGDSSNLLFDTSEDESFDDDGDLPLPSLDPDMVR